MDFYKIEKKDNVAVALRDFQGGEIVEIDGEKIVVKEPIPPAHKIALKDFNGGDAVIKYGNIMGFASTKIQKGNWVHAHNVNVGSEAVQQYEYELQKEGVVYPASGDVSREFYGYLRSDGQVGIRNHLLILPTVFCANGNVKEFERLANTRYGKSEIFDGAIALTHPNGCSQTGYDLDITCKILSGMIHNANFGGVLVVSLGCEVTDLKQLKLRLGEYDESRVKFLVMQDVEDEYEEALLLIDQLMKEMKKDKRTPQPISKLHIAMNCGGSDGHSGITANKITGTLCDRLVAEGATMSMTEVPEMFGAEHLLMNRCVNEKVFEDLVEMINTYKHYFEKYGERASDNPTQGNKAGGLSTLQEKSLGCINKGGSCAVTQVLKYGERATKNGLVLVSGPGNDLAGISAQIAAGAVLTIFTTGRGTPCGFAGPTFRLSSNTALAKKKPGWIDFDAGRLLEADTEAKKTALADQLYQMIMDTANGNYRTKTEQRNYYQLAMLRDGVTL